MKDDKDKAQETERLKLAVMSHIEHGLGKDPAYSSTFDHYLGLSYTLRDKLMEMYKGHGKPGTKDGGYKGG